MINVVGSNISGLIFLSMLTDNNKECKFFINGSLGSGWGGLRRDGQLLDLGQRFFELDFENSTKEPLQNFKLGKGHRNFVHLVKNFINVEGHSLEKIKVEAYFRGKIIKCPLETVDLKGLISSFSDKEIIAIKNELESFPSKHPAQEMSEVGYESSKHQDKNLGEMLTVNHGKTFNKLAIYPFMSKFNIDLSSVPLSLRRKLWCPVFYKKTILESIEGIPSFVPSRDHFRIKQNSTSAMIDCLSQRLRKNLYQLGSVPNISSNLISFENGTTLPTDKVLMASSASSLAQMLDIKDNIKRRKLRLIWIKLNVVSVLREIDYLSVIDERYQFFRVSSSSHSDEEDKIIYCVETLNLTVGGERIINDLKDMGLIDEKETPVIFSDINAPVIDEPTFENRTVFNQTVEKIRIAAPNLDLTLSHLHFGQNSFNDQVLQGMKMVRDFEIEKY